MTKLEMALQLLPIVDKAQKDGHDVELHYESKKLELDLWGKYESGSPKLIYFIHIDDDLEFNLAIQTIKNLQQ